MHKIGILEDRPGELVTTRTILARNLNDPDWMIVEVPLLATPERIVEWLMQEDVNVLVADQVLDDISGQRPITYQGHEVIEAVRRHIPDMPVYMITAFKDKPEIESNLSQMEEMVPRGKLGERAPILVERMKRAGASFAHRHRAALSRLSELSAKKAAARLTSAEKAELASLQTALNLADTSETRANLLPALEREVEKLEELQSKAAALLRKAKARK